MRPLKIECRRVQADIDALDRLADDPPGRRVHLWLRALEKEDSDAIEFLRRADPDAERRVKAFIASKEIEAPLPVRRDDRRWYGWLQDRFFETYVDSSVTCACDRCLNRRDDDGSG
jgi:hypothetical protein